MAEMDKNDAALVPQNESADDSFDEVLEEVLEGVPADAQQNIRRMMRLTASITQVSSPQGDISRKITTDILNTMVKNADESDKREYEDRKSNRKFSFAILIVILVTLLILVFALKSTPDLLEKFIPSLITLAAGAIGGYGYGYKKGSSGD